VCYISLMLQYVAPCVVISVCYWRVSVALRRRARAKKGLTGSATSTHAAAARSAITVARTTDDNRANATAEGPRIGPSSTVTVSRRDQLEIRRNRRTNRMLIASVAIFVCCWLPLNVINLIFEYLGDEIFVPYFLLTFFIFHVFAMSSTVYNPFLYAWMNESFRIEFMRVLPHCLVVAFGCGGGVAGDGVSVEATRRGHNGAGTTCVRNEKGTVCNNTSAKPTLLVGGGGGGGGGTANEIRQSPSMAGSALAAISANDVVEPDEAAKLMSATDDEVIVMTSTTQF